VVDVGLRYLAPARFGDEIVIESRIAEVERVRDRFEYVVRRADAASTLLCRGHTLLAGTDRELRPRRLPESVRAKMRSLTAPAETPGSIGPDGSA
jgi:acyl-CoA thioesterase FadM